MIIKKGTYVDDRPVTKLVTPLVVTNPDLKVFVKAVKINA